MSDINLDLENLQGVAKTVRFLAADAVEKANSGHPGMPLGCADLATVLWARHLRFDPADPAWPGRDRFILSAGHGCMLQYALLHLFGFDLSLDDLKNFRQFGSKTPGHPEYGHTPGVEVTTGPLSQGLANSAGMALAAKMAGNRFAAEGFDPFAARIYAIAGDGCLMEGVGYEACSLAGHLRLDNLVVLYDNNHITIDGATGITFSEDVRMRFEGFGWAVHHIDGHDMRAVDGALDAAKTASRPSLIICDTHIAFGAPTKHDSAKSHGEPLGKEEIAGMRKALSWPDETFFVPEETRAFCGRVVDAKKSQRAEWDAKFSDYCAADKPRADRFDDFLSRHLPDNLLQDLINSVPKKADATRSLSFAVEQTAAARIPWLAGGSADLAGSNKSDIKDAGTVAAGNFAGRNIHFGIREHAMGAIANGMAAFGGWRPITATFLVFSDYMRPAIRLAALMKLPVIYLFTHDSFQLGEDGPTHQPVEHLEALRQIPNLRVLRPADGVECAGAWFSALHYEGPTAIVLTRQKVPMLEHPAGYHVTNLLAGAQVLDDSMDEMATLVATGSEVWVALEAAKKLKAEGIHVRVVSMMSRTQFLARPEEERHRFVPYGRPVCSIEAGCTSGWAVVTGRRGLRIGLDHFGASAPEPALREHFGFTPDAVAAQIKKWLGGLTNLGRLDVTIRA